MTFKWTPPTFPRSTKKVVVSGTPTFDDQNFLNTVLNQVTFWFDATVLVHGGDKHWSPALGKYVGPGWLAQNWAFKKWHTVVDFLPNKDKYGKKANSIRDEEMVRYGDVFVLFWDENSPETLEFLSLLSEYKRPFKLVRYCYGGKAGTVRRAEKRRI